MSNIETLLKDKKYDTALQLCQTALKEKQSYKLYVFTGAAHYGLRDRKSAVKYYEKAINLDSDKVQAWSGLLKVFTEFGHNFDRALAVTTYNFLCDKIHRDKPQWFPAALGQLELRHGDDNFDLASSFENLTIVAKSDFGLQLNLALLLCKIPVLGDERHALIRDLLSREDNPFCVEDYEFLCNAYVKGLSPSLGYSALETIYRKLLTRFFVIEVGLRLAHIWLEQNLIYPRMSLLEQVLEQLNPHKSWIRDDPRYHLLRDVVTNNLAWMDDTEVDLPVRLCYSFQQDCRAGGDVLNSVDRFESRLSKLCEQIDTSYRRSPNMIVTSVSFLYAHAYLTAAWFLCHNLCCLQTARIRELLDGVARVWPAEVNANDSTVLVYCKSWQSNIAQLDCCSLTSDDIPTLEMLSYALITAGDGPAAKTLLLSREAHLSTIGQYLLSVTFSLTNNPGQASQIHFKASNGDVGEMWCCVDIVRQVSAIMSSPVHDVVDASDCIVSHTPLRSSCSLIIQTLVMALTDRSSNDRSLSTRLRDCVILLESADEKRRTGLRRPRWLATSFASLAARASHFDRTLNYLQGIGQSSIGCRILTSVCHSKFGAFDTALQILEEGCTTLEWNSKSIHTTVAFKLTLAVALSNVGRLPDGMAVVDSIFDAIKTNCLVLEDRLSTAIRHVQIELALLSADRALNDANPPQPLKACQLLVKAFVSFCAICPAHFALSKSDTTDDCVLRCVYIWQSVSRVLAFASTLPGDQLLRSFMSNLPKRLPTPLEHEIISPFRGSFNRKVTTRFITKCVSDHPQVLGDSFLAGENNPVKPLREMVAASAFKAGLVCLVLSQKVSSVLVFQKALVTCAFAKFQEHSVSPTFDTEQLQLALTFALRGLSVSPHQECLNLALVCSAKLGFVGLTTKLVRFAVKSNRHSAVPFVALTLLLLTTKNKLAVGPDDVNSCSVLLKQAITLQPTWHIPWFLRAAMACAHNDPKQSRIVLHAGGLRASRLSAVLLAAKTMCNARMDDVETVWSRRLAYLSSRCCVKQNNREIFEMWKRGVLHPLTPEQTLARDVVLHAQYSMLSTSDLRLLVRCLIISGHYFKAHELIRGNDEFLTERLLIKILEKNTPLLEPSDCVQPSETTSILLRFLFEFYVSKNSALALNSLLTGGHESLAVQFALHCGVCQNIPGTAIEQLARRSDLRSVLVFGIFFLRSDKASRSEIASIVHAKTPPNPAPIWTHVKILVRTNFKNGLSWRKMLHQTPHLATHDLPFRHFGQICHDSRLSTSKLAILWLPYHIYFDK